MVNAHILLFLNGNIWVKMKLSGHFDDGWFNICADSFIWNFAK